MGYSRHKKRRRSYSRENRDASVTTDREEESVTPDKIQAHRLLKREKRRLSYSSKNTDALVTKDKTEVTLFDWSVNGIRGGFDMRCNRIEGERLAYFGIDCVLLLVTVTVNSQQ